MPRKTLAPTLRKVMPLDASWRDAEDRQAVRELRALLAVANAVERVRPYGPGWEERCEAVFKAQERLRRESEGR